MANDIIDINVSETVDSVSITVNPNLTTVNINQVTGGLNQTLQSVTDLGATTTNSITANSFVKSGGTSAQILAANGSVITAGTNITISGGQISSTGGGAATNLTTSQTDTNFTINSDTGTDASVPLGNGTLAGATLNNYTTAEKNKLGAITGTNTGDQNLQSVTDIGAITTNSITSNSITTTIDSTINGVTVGRGNISGNVSENTVVGFQALQSVVHTTGNTGYYNTAFGEGALKLLTTGSINDAFGNFALNKCTTGTFNLAIGAAAMKNSTTATINTAIGQYALRDNLSGTKNTAVGNSALMQNTGSFNTAIGSYAGGGVSSTGTENILVGYQAGSSISSGRNNLLIENQSGGTITSGSYNIILNPKQKSGVTTGSNNTIIGCFDNTFATGLTSNVIIANGLGSIRFQSTDTGLTTVPSQTNALIIEDTTGKAVATKEYVASVAGGVPYTGATSDVNLGEFGIQLGNLEFDNTPTNIPTAAGSMYYNDTDGTLDLILKGGNVKLQIGQESVVRVVNKTATNIDLLEANYQAVRVTGAQGQRLKVDLAQATNDVLSAETIGLVTETIANNAEGFITTSGLVRNINTTGSLQSETWLDGDVLYLSPTVAGRITKVKPIAPNHLVIIGYVISAHATQGTIFVKVDNGYELDELHNVKIDAVTNNEVLSYTSATDIWENKTPSEAGIQPTLVSATNIKTINGNTLLGSGDLVISGTGISSLNGLTGATQTFSVTTNTGTGIPAWTSLGTNHQLNIPIAGAAAVTGLITGTSQFISGTKTFQSNPEIPVPAGNTTSCIVLGSAGGGGATGTLQIGSTTIYPNGQEMQYVKGITSSVQTQLDGKASGLDVAEQTYSLSPTFTGTAPTIISSSTYQWNQLGTLVTGRVNLIYTTAGSISQVVIPLPTDMPTPLTPTGLSGALDILYYGVGMFNTLTTSVATVGRTCLLRRNAANTGYEFVITHSAAVSSRVISLTLQYFTEWNI